MAGRAPDGRQAGPTNHHLAARAAPPCWA